MDRRHKIAHEADIDPTLGLGNRWRIDEVLVNDAVDFLEQVVESIHAVLEIINRRDAEDAEGREERREGFKCG